MFEPLLNTPERPLQVELPSKVWSHNCCGDSRALGIKCGGGRALGTLYEIW